MQTTADNIGQLLNQNRKIETLQQDTPENLMAIHDALMTEEKLARQAVAVSAEARITAKHVWMQAKDRLSMALEKKRENGEKIKAMRDRLSVPRVKKEA